MFAKVRFSPCLKIGDFFLYVKRFIDREERIRLLLYPQTANWEEQHEAKRCERLCYADEHGRARNFRCPYWLRNKSSRRCDARHCCHRGPIAWVCAQPLLRRSLPSGRLERTMGVPAQVGSSGREGSNVHALKYPARADWHHHDDHRRRILLPRSSERVNTSPMRWMIVAYIEPVTRRIAVPNIWKMVFLTSGGLPDRDSYSGLAKLCGRYPTTSIVVLSGQHEAMLGALQLMFGGSPNVHAEIIAGDDVPDAKPNEKKPLIMQSQPSSSDLGLTERQLDVLALMMQGKSNKAICRVLNLAEPTVKNHVTTILRALRVSNRTEAVIAVGELGWKLPAKAQLALQSTRRSRACSGVLKKAPAESAAGRRDTEGDDDVHAGPRATDRERV
jgi:DNA-binding NarL/FixJ family response regulator